MIYQAQVLLRGLGLSAKQADKPVALVSVSGSLFVHMVHLIRFGTQLERGRARVEHWTVAFPDCPGPSCETQVSFAHRSQLASCPELRNTLT